ncbi:unnamed protein product [Brassica oleracea var. botrytis]|uniref:(rape) hypothetical protein n=1 Tax=Brassica napus TaxID=3708 RepID=A0A816JLG2_BRANA|nr:unnamed protein product [Brassica napus]
MFTVSQQRLKDKSDRHQSQEPVYHRREGDTTGAKSRFITEEKVIQPEPRAGSFIEENTRNRSQSQPFTVKETQPWAEFRRKTPA